jgi:hypothetical protein
MGFLGEVLKELGAVTVDPEPYGRKTQRHAKRPPHF